MSSTIHFGKVVGEYTFDGDAANPYYHYREVDWFATDIPRSNFDQDILYSFGAFMTVCKITRNDAENRINDAKEQAEEIVAQAQEEAENVLYSLNKSI